MTTIINGSSPSVTFSDGTTQTTAYPSTQTFGFKNRFINGAMLIDQRNAGASTTITATAYTLDRWQAYCGGVSSKFSVQQTPSATETGYATRVAAGFTSYLGCTSLSAYSISSSDRFGINQTIEGLNASDLAWGTSSAKTITLSFWVYSSLTGTFGGSIQNYAATRSYPFSYTISAANTWAQVSITVAGDTSGTWLTTSSGFATINFGIGTGSTYSGTANAWATADYRSTTGATSVVGTSGATFYITGVQLEIGSVASSFDFRDYGRELILCQRYYQKSYPSAAVPGSTTTNENAIQMDWGSQTSGIASTVFALPVVMRTSPTGVSYDLVGTSGKVSTLDGGATVTNNVAYNSLTPTAERFYLRIFGLTVYGISFMYTLSAEL
jgi:hypothetical protein